MGIIISCLVAAIAIVAAIAVITYVTLAKALNRVIKAGAETDKQVTQLKNSQARTNRHSQLTRHFTHDLDSRISQLETLTGEKTNETPIRNTRTSSYDAGARRRG